MRNFFQNFAGRFADAPNSVPALISSYLEAGGDVFDRAAFLRFAKNSNNYGNISPAGTPSAYELLPIEFFKDQTLLPHFCTNEQGIVRTFRSSGTTQKTQSESPFSEQGLALYQATALQTFYATLRRLFPTPADPFAMPGFSFIPDSTAWPTSSLAQMITWFAQESDVTFLSDENPAACISELSKAQQPVWVFGTAFHFVNLLDSGFRCRLPEGSIVIETGGTKGRSRSVTREELFALIADGFQIAEKQIISEYSMSELATQSWDFGNESHTSRRYQFPAWVGTYVLTKEGAIAKEGTGALIIDDPLRIDLKSAIRTEDIVSLDKHGFQILRRSNAAPLKGCSLLAERIMPPSSAAKKPAIQAPREDHSQPAERAQIVHDLCLSLLTDAGVIKSFFEEFGSDLLARYASEDLRTSLGQSADDLVSAARHAAAKKDQHWTIIAPNNHSLAAVHPIVVAFVAGMDIAVRIPEKFFGSQSFLRRLITSLNESRPGFAAVLPPGQHIAHESDIWNGGNILVFGSDETIANLSNIAPGRISGFGDTIAIGVGSLDDVKKYGAKIVRDFFSLRQSGCMSPRLFLLDARSQNEGQMAADILAEHARKYQSAMTVDDAASVHGEGIRYQLQLAGVRTASMQPLLIAAHGNKQNGYESCIASKAFVLPVIAAQFPDADAFVNNLKSLVLPELNVGLLLSATDGIYSQNLAESIKSPARLLSFRSFGMAQAPRFSGLHEGRPLFQISC